jgi:hypothetical protein
MIGRIPGWARIMSTLLFVIGLLFALAELESPDLALWTGKAVAGTEVGSIVSYSYAGAHFSFDARDRPAYDPPIPVVVYVDHECLAPECSTSPRRDGRRRPLCSHPLSPGSRWRWEPRGAPPSAWPPRSGHARAASTGQASREGRLRGSLAAVGGSEEMTAHRNRHRDILVDHPFLVRNRPALVASFRHRSHSGPGSWRPLQQCRQRQRRHRCRGLVPVASAPPR